MENIDGYQIFAELKQGPVSTIYKALDLHHHQIVLIKLLHLEAMDSAPWRHQFMQESKISLRLAHNNLRRTLHAGTYGEQPYLVLEYVEGPTLFELIRRHRKLPLDVCIFIAKEIAQALAGVHRHKVLHNDVKPQNVFLSFNGAVKLGDLGLARELKESHPLLAGTPAYMSPEYILGQETNEASDLFSFGAVLYEMLTAEMAFIGRTLATTLLHVANWDPVPITKLRPDTPQPLLEICQKLLAKNPAERYHDAEAVILDLTKLERQCGLNTSAQNLASFLEAPEQYPLVNLQVMTAPPVPPKRASSSFSVPNMGLLAILSATMFLAGVLFIKVLKDFMYDETPAQHANLPVSAPLRASGLGYLEVLAAPGSIVYIDGDSIGATPFAQPLALPTGIYDLDVKPPRAFSRAETRGEAKSLKVQISAGDTLRQKLELTNL